MYRPYLFFNTVSKDSVRATKFKALRMFNQPSDQYVHHAPQTTSKSEFVSACIAYQNRSIALS